MKKIIIYLLFILTFSPMVYAESEKALFDKGVAFLKEENFPKAIDAFTQLITIAPGNPDAFKNRGVAHMKMNQYDQAIQDFEKTRGIKPDLKGLYSNLGVAWYYKGDYTKAIDNYNMEIALTPNNHYAYFNRAICRAEIGEFVKSLEDVDKSLELSSDFYLALCLKGDLLVKLDQPLKAKQAYSDAVQVDPGQTYAKERIASLSSEPSPQVKEVKKNNNDIGKQTVNISESKGEKPGGNFVVEKKIGKRPEKKAARESVPTATEVSTELSGESSLGKTVGTDVWTESKYELQAGAFQVYKNAQDLKDRLSDKGYQIRILELTRPSNIKWFLVRIGTYGSLQEAETAEIKAKTKLDTDIIVRPFNQF